MDTLDRETWSPHDQLAIFAFPLPIHTPYPVTLCHQVGPVSVACWYAALFLSRSACLLRAPTSSLEQFLCLRILTVSQSPLLFHIHHPSGRRGDNAIRLAPVEHVLVPAEHVPIPGGGPRGESVTDIYIYIYVYASSDLTAALHD